MKPQICPKCQEASLVSIGDGYVKCESCGYIGFSTFNNDIFRK